MQTGADGYLHAINPEAGFFGVAPGTNAQTNPNVMAALKRQFDLHQRGDDGVARTLVGRHRPRSRRRTDRLARPQSSPAATAPRRSRIRGTRCRRSRRRASRRAGKIPAGVPISAFIFGGRRARLAPLVYESLSWQHGVFVGATMASETTAATPAQVGVTRRDPMAMLPFCGYHMGDYFQHWLDMGRAIPHPPKIFHVNWFRKGADGKFLWPGFGDNVRVLKWILERVEGKGQAAETPIGFVPTRDALTLDGLNISPETMEELLRVDPADWQKEAEETADFLRNSATACRRKCGTSWPA